MKGCIICVIGVINLVLVVWSEVHVRHEMLMTLNGVVCDADSIRQIYGSFVKDRGVLLCWRFLISGVIVFLREIPLTIQSITP